MNPFHLATIDDLEDPLALQGRSDRLTRNRIGRAPGQATLEYLLSREELSPTDYSLSWALTHFLATRRYDAFIAYLKTMSRMPRSPHRTPPTTPSSSARPSATTWASLARASTAT